MRITDDTPERLELRGRRQDGEEGHPGLWLLWLVAAALSLGGGAFARFGPERGMRLAGLACAAFGALIGVFGLVRLARRERLAIDRRGRRLVYVTRVWPRPAREELRASFDDVKEVRLRQRREGPSGGRHGPSVAYDVWEARLLVRPRRVLGLERSTDEARVRALAETVARAVGTTVRE